MNIVIINSLDFWSMGWATTPESQQDVIESLSRAGIQTQIYEVSHKQQLDELLVSLKSEPCLIWPNAYQVYAFEGRHEVVWLADVIHEHGLPMIGSSAQALKNVLCKDHCQHLLEKHNVPIPSFLAVQKEDTSRLATLLGARQMHFPLFVKPNALSTSKGINQECITEDMVALKRQIQRLGEDYGYPVMVEEFLPGRDITVAVFLTPDPIVLATYYDTEIHDSPEAVLDYATRMRDWNDGKWLNLVEDPEILAQIHAAVVPACRAVGITEFTRIDCRLDQNGQLKIFDINGLPGLENPFSTTVWQMIVKLPDEAQQLAFDTLVSLILYCSAQRHHLSAPERIRKLAEEYILREGGNWSATA